MASRVSEQEVCLKKFSVLKAVGFVFTENPLQALVLRTVDMTHLWDARVAPVSAQCRASGPHWEDGVSSRPQGLLWLDAYGGLLCRDWALHQFTR